jgi:glycosyltransferase involved in cell wall biosynthesis
VVRYAHSVFAAAMTEGADHRLHHLHGPAAGFRNILADCALVHVHVTDRLFGRTPAKARRAVLSMIEGLRRPVSVTLHDLPQPSDGPVMAARIEFYRAVARAASGVIVSSRHEAGLFAEYVDAGVAVEVVPLMFDDVRADKPARAGALTVGVLGFLYPGKGHMETLRAMARLDPSVGFVALGKPSPSHEYLADELGKVAADMGRRFEITGFLTDDELRSRAAAITVPVAYHRHMSASGSINAWISSGRRPLVPRTDYTEELVTRSPGVVSIHANDDAALREAIEHAFVEPDSTWLDSSTVPSPTPAEVATTYERLLRRWSA